MSIDRGPVARRVVVGLGNPWRGDDGIGPAVAAAVRVLLGPDVEVITLDGEPARILAAIEHADVAVLIDAMESGRTPGSVVLVDPDQRSGPTRTSTHGIGVADAIALGRQLDVLPPTLHVVGVEGSEFGQGRGLSPSVQLAAVRASQLVRDLLSPD